MIEASLSICKNLDEIIVVADRLAPGIKAKHWKTPITIKSKKFTCGKLGGPLLATEEFSERRIDAYTQAYREVVDKKY